MTGRGWPRLGVWAAGLPSQAPAHGSAWPVYIPVISEILQASSFKSRHAGEETHQRSERPRETGRRIRAGVRGQPAWPVLPPGQQGPWLVLQELRPDARRRRVERVICSWKRGQGSGSLLRWDRWRRVGRPAPDKPRATPAVPPGRVRGRPPSTRKGGREPGQHR